jgi:DNA repair exonuclease SbcCD ATPase subunit
VFLGDIHKMSFFTDRIAYCGSLLQLDCMESLVKGYILWDLKKKKGNFQQILNDYGRVKINISKEKEYNVDITTLPKYVDLDIECETMDRNDVEDLYMKITYGKTKILKKTETMKFDQNTFDTKMKIGNKLQDLLLIKNKDDVIDLMMSKLDKIVKKDMIEDLKKNVSEVLKDYKFTETNGKKNIMLLNIKFCGMNVFGDDNYVDFTKFKKIVGISEGNSSGKSSFVDVILYSIFGQCTRGSKFDMINFNKKLMTSEVILDVNGLIYKIVRKVSKNSATAREAKEDLTIYENDKNISCKNIKQTQKIIEQKICTFFDFVISCVVTQKSVSQGSCVGFAELRGDDRKNTLCKIARLDVYDYLFDEYKRLLTGQGQLIGRYNTALLKYDKYGKTKDEIHKNLIKHISDLEMNISINNNNLKKYNDDKEILQKFLSQSEIKNKILENNIDNLTNQIKYDVEDVNIDNIDIVIDDIINDIVDIDKQIKTMQKDKQKIEKELFKIGDIDVVKNDFEFKKKMKIDDIKSQIKLKQKNIWNNSYDYSKYDVKLIDKKEKELELEYEKNKKQIEITNTKIQECDTVINIVDDDTIINKFVIFESKQEQMNDLIQQNKNFDNELIKYGDKMKSVLLHEYDKNCKYCMKNTMTLEKLYLEDIILNLNKNKNENIKKINVIKKYIEKNKNIVDEHNVYINNIDFKKTSSYEKCMLLKDLEILINKNIIVQQKLDEIFLIKENYAKYLKNEQYEEEINKLENEIEKIINEKSDKLIKYDDLCENLDEINNSLKRMELDIEKMKNLKEKNIKIKNEYSSQKKLFDELKNIKDEKINLELELKKKKIEFDKLINMMTNENKKIIENTKELTELKQTQLMFGELYENIKCAEKKKDEYTLLMKILREDDGIVNFIMTKNLLPKFNEIVNGLLLKFGEPIVKMVYEKGFIDIYDENGIDIVKSGGYRSYLNNLIYRLAISQVNGYMSTNFMIIDEILDSSDNENKKNIKKLIEYLRVKNDWNLIISHDNDIKDAFETTLKITKSDKLKNWHKIQF